MSKDPIFDDIREKVLAAAYEDVVFRGWHGEVLHQAAARARVDRSSCELAFPHGIDDLLLFFFSHGDQTMMERLGSDARPEKIRERIAVALRQRLLADSPQREVLRRAMAACLLPGRHALGLKATYSTVDAIWRWAGDQSTDYNFYSKRAILAAVLKSSRLYFLDDDSLDYADSWAFIDRRIENVMQFEKVKARYSSLSLEKPLTLVKRLSRWRYGMPSATNG